MLEDKPPTDVEFNDAIQRIQDFFSLEGTIHQLSDTLYTHGRRSAFSDSDLRSIGGKNGHFTGHAFGKSFSEEIQGSLPSSHTLGPPPSRFGDSLPYRDGRPDQKAAPVPLRTLTLPSSGPTDAGGALGGVLGLAPSPTTGERPAEDTLPEHDSLESQVPALPARRTWRLEGHDRRMSDDEEVPIERNAVERNRNNKMDGIRMPLESGLSSSLRAARGGVPEREPAISECNRENSEVDSGVITSFTPRMPNISSDRVLSPNFAKERTSSSTASNSNASIVWKLKLGIPQTEETPADQERNMKYIHIPERGREQFQQFAKALKDKLTIECAESNPYVKALCQHRQEMAESGLDLGKEAVDSLPARLATERSDALASMETDEELARERPNCDLYCKSSSNCEKRPRWDMMELQLPEMEERLRRRNGGALVPSLTAQQQQALSSERSTTAESQRSELEARRIVFPNGSASRSSNQDSLRLRIGRNRLDLSAGDRADFLSAIGAAPPGPPVLKSPTPSNVSIPRLSVRASEGDISPSPNIDGD